MIGSVDSLYIVIQYGLVFTRLEQSYGYGDFSSESVHMYI